MKLSNRDRYLIEQAFTAGSECFYSNVDEWLDDNIADTGDVVEDHLAFAADQIVDQPK